MSVASNRKGMLLVISGPSGAGKSKLCECLLQEDRRFQFSVSATTRAKRQGEECGKHYYFLSKTEFQSKADGGEFLEWAVVHGHLYGTLRKEVLANLSSGLDVLLDIDSQGAHNVSVAMPDCVTVFIMPPSYTSLRERLRTRNTDQDTEIERRLANAKKEIEQLFSYHYAIINTTLEEAMAQLRAIVVAERLRTMRFNPVIPL